MSSMDELIEPLSFEGLHYGVLSVKKYRTNGPKSSGHSFNVLSKDELFMFGGLSEKRQTITEFSSKLWRLNLKNGIWVQEETRSKNGVLPEGRQFHTMTCIERGKKWILIGGWAVGYHVARHDELWELSYSEEEGFMWEKLSCEPTVSFVTIWLHSSLWDEDHQCVWIVGGLLDSGSKGKLNLIWKQGNGWVWNEPVIVQNQEDREFSPRFGQSSLWYEKKIVIFGGLLDTEPTLQSLHPFDGHKYCSNELFIIDTTKFDGEQVRIQYQQCKGDVPRGRYSHAACIHDHKMLIFSGIAISYAIVDSEMYSLDLFTFTWRKISLNRSITGRARMGVAKSEDHALFLYGGQKRKNFNDLYEFPFKKSSMHQNLCNILNRNIFTDCSIQFCETSKKRNCSSKFSKHKRRKKIEDWKVHEQ